MDYLRWSERRLTDASSRRLLQARAAISLLTRSVRFQRPYSDQPDLPTDRATSCTGKNDLIIYPLLRRAERAPATSVVLDIDFDIGSDRLQWLVERHTPEQPLSQDELHRLDLARLTGTDEIEAVLAIRGDLGRTNASPRESKAAIKQVDRHLAACRRINRGKDRAAEGSSAGGGYRRDQQGGIKLVPFNFRRQVGQSD